MNDNVVVINAKEKAMHEIIMGKTERGVAKRTLSAYASHWGKEIPEHLLNFANDYYSAKEAGNLLGE